MGVDMKKRKKRQRQVLVQKNYLPTALLTLVLWALLGFIVWRVDPVVMRDLFLPNSYFVFLALLFFALALTGTLLLAHTRRGFSLAGLVVLFLYLRLHGLGNVINGLLMAGLFVAVEYYVRNRQA